MRWFGFGFNIFGQIYAHDKSTTEGTGDTVKDVKVSSPTELTACSECCSKPVDGVKASWSGRASLHLGGHSSVCLTGFGALVSSDSSLKQSRGCTDVLLSEGYLSLAFPDRVESWDLQKGERDLAWSKEIKPQLETAGPTLSLPLVPGGYIALKPPFYRSLSPLLKAKSLSLSAEHAVLLTASGAVYTWGMGSHGQLGHGGLTPEEEPRAVEALWGMPMSCVAAGGWHSICISDGGDLYVWGWNESGQLGLPSRGLRRALQEEMSPRAEAGLLNQRATTSPSEEPQESVKDEEVFISIQAFPALLDVSPSCEIKTVSCGSRHTAAVTTKGDLYTWGWGDYGQLGHQSLVSVDEPKHVEFFTEQQMRVVGVVCGAWTTYAAVIKEEENV